MRRVSVWRTDDRWAAGVAAGIAHRYGLDPLLVRGLFVVATLFGGLGLVLYGAAWMLLPEASDGRIHLEEAVRGRFDIALAGATAVVVVGLSRPVFWWHGSWWALPWTVALVAIIAVVLLSANRTAPSAGPAPSGSPTPAVAPAAAPTDPPAATGRPDYDVQEDTMSPRPPGTASNDASSGDTQTLPDAGGQSPADAAGDHATAAYDGGWGGSSGGWDGGSGATGSWDGGTPAAHEPPPPPTPPTPPTPGPDPRLTSLVLAVGLLATAGIVAAHSVGVLSGNVWLIAGGTLLAVLGAGVLISGVRGRTQGGIGGLALVAAILLVPATTASTVVPGLYLGGDADTIAGDQIWVPTTPERAAEGYSLVAGELVVDLTELDDDARIPASVTFGNLHIIVPDDADVTVNARVAAGEVLGRVGEDWTSGAGRWDSSWGEDRISNGVGVDVTLGREGARRAPEFTIDAEVTFGQIIIEEERS